MLLDSARGTASLSRKLHGWMPVAGLWVFSASSDVSIICSINLSSVSGSWRSCSPASCACFVGGISWFFLLLVWFLEMLQACRWFLRIDMCSFSFFPGWAVLCLTVGFLLPPRFCPASSSSQYGISHRSSFSSSDC